MIKKFLVVCLFSVFPFSNYLNAAETPIVDVISSSTGQVINATVLESIPGTGIDWQTLKVSVPDVAVTGLTQPKANSTDGYLFTLNSNRSIRRARIRFGSSGVIVDPFKKFGVKISELYPALQPTQFTKPLAVSTFSNDQYKAFFVNEKGFYSHHNSQIFPTFSDVVVSFAAGSSADGRYSWKSAETSTFDFYGIQRLDEKFKRIGDPSFIQVNPIISGDISGEVQGGQRLFVFREVRSRKGEFQTRVAVQKFDSSTLQLIGNAYGLTKFKFTPFLDAENTQSIAVDPRGLGVAYTSYSSTCKKEVLKYRALDDQFRPSGKSKLLIGCEDVKDTEKGVFGLDILPLSLSF